MIEMDFKRKGTGMDILEGRQFTLLDYGDGDSYELGRRLRLMAIRTMLEKAKDGYVARKALRGWRNPQIGRHPFQEMIRVLKWEMWGLSVGVPYGFGKQDVKIEGTEKGIRVMAGKVSMTMAWTEIAEWLTRNAHKYEKVKRSKASRGKAR